MHTLSRWRNALVLICILGMTPVANSTEKAAEPPSEQRELEALREEVKRLREAQAEPCTDTHQPPPAGGVEGGTLKYLLKARWDRLDRGMEKDEVRVLLGWPNTVTHSAAGQVEIWGYGDPQTNRYGVGTIYFDDDEEVSTWVSPTFNTH